MTDKPAVLTVVKNKPGRKPLLSKLWSPTVEQTTLIENLASLNWPVAMIAEDVLMISQQALQGAIERLPALSVAYERGREKSKDYPSQQLSWRPMPAHLEDVKRYAANGLDLVQIAGKLQISRQSLTAALQQVPQLSFALEQGEGEFQSKCIEKFYDDLEAENPMLRVTAQPQIFRLKMKCGFVEKSAAKQIEVAGTVSHVHEMKVPEPVPITEMADFAAKEMARAREISAKRLAEFNAARLAVIED